MKKHLSKSNIALILVSILFVGAVLGLGIPLALTLDCKKESERHISGIYQNNYYETLDCIQNIENNLSKANVIERDSLQQDIFNDIWKDCDVACSNIAKLSTQNKDLEKLIGILNQLGDYSYYLSKKIRDNDLDSKEQENIETFSKLMKEINTTFANINSNIQNGDLPDDFVAKLDSMTTDISKIDYASIDYPELIYDGPFSDALSDRETKFLKDKEEITKEQSIEKIKKQYKGASEIKYNGESQGSIPSYNFTMKYNNLEAFVQISKQGGYTVLFDSYCHVTNPKIDEEEGEKKAEAYLKNLGYDDLKAVWVCNNNSTIYYNFAYHQDDVTIYPDLIKVKICAENGNLLGIEAQSYLYNHTERELPEKTMDNVTISHYIEVTSKAYALVPTEWNTEILCLEVTGRKNDSLYYIYYDIKTGRTEKILLVIDEEGKRLI